ncbi:hypothetical protein GCM10025868_27490 [Angustibacter aerolatus]|uniref:Uncharacterized protein n=1 Tax=Angustibacter aerolatus TaxID=1162965 RepID=A0ABQ6JK47_9ACTN|nr:hypothetical protein GCM10025868_27490 [Angustibacter aerolatus]
MQYAKVAEFQARAVVHFHALIRLDGPKTATGFAPAPAGFDAAALARIVQTTVAAVQATADPAFETDPGRVLRFGAQVDARPVSVRHRDDDPDQPLTPEQVAGYIAKYATKSAADTFDAKPGQRPRCTCSASARLVEQFGAHAREESRIHYPADPSPYVRMGRWVHMLGFRGHFSTKSRRYSVTLGRLRRARRRWHTIAADAARTGTPLDVAEPGSQAPGRRRRHRDHPRRRGLDVRRRRVDHRRRRRPGPCRCRPRP